MQINSILVYSILSISSILMKYGKNVTGREGNIIITSACSFIYTVFVNKITVFWSISELRTINS